MSSRLSSGSGGLGGILRASSSLRHVAASFFLSTASYSFTRSFKVSVRRMFAACGLLPPVAGAVTQEVIDLLAVLNALRTARLPAKLTDFREGRWTPSEAPEGRANAAA